MLFHKIAILGVGLIGASFALAARQRAIAGRIAGWGRNAHRLEMAKGQGIIDEYSLSLEEAAREADFVLLASPVGTFTDIARQIAGFLRPGTIVSDVGSVKGSLVDEIEAAMPQGVPFVGVHPIAGTENSGFEFAYETLFDGADCVITPTAHTDARALAIVEDLWGRLGTKILLISPQRHDEIFSSVSHLPHVIVYALVNAVQNINEEFLSYCGSGFRDTTRIAMSSSDIWTDICFLNRDNILKHIKAYKEELDHLAGFLQTQDRQAFMAKVEEARYSRKNIALKNNKQDGEY